MLPGIVALNDKICDLEKEFGVTFTRNLGKGFFMMFENTKLVK